MRHAFQSLAAAMLLAALLPDAAPAQMAGQGHGMGHHHGADGTGHDEVNMPGLRGLDALPEESADMATLFRNVRTFDRTVSNLPNGIRTVTASDDPEVMAALLRHVAEMITRVEEGRDPQVFIQSPTLDVFFARGDEIRTEIEITDDGIVVVQTAEAPDLVEALHLHAAEVSDMAQRGMAAVHERMMTQRPTN
ncbi:hypothetical protein [Maliponia aquimaris]|uniref:Uncharacterized protein n=1 Tax=Maliponia aquimaris TaxID=1673631 RepID=A0A238K4J9_9RHOB|nr:hypothetical protein [Maliponia aquimaris]SMX37848.1 hypothetical protein MAA8898_01282 [Maliponia aquimaris]